MRVGTKQGLLNLCREPEQQHLCITSDVISSIYQINSYELDLVVNTDSIMKINL